MRQVFQRWRATLRSRGAVFHRWRVRSGDGEQGDATVEFIGITVCIVVPALYLIIALGMVQAAMFAAESGAREAARILAENPENIQVAQAQLDAVCQDYGVECGSMTVTCHVCEGTRQDVEVTVHMQVHLLLVPRWMGGDIPVSAVSRAPRWQVVPDDGE